MKSAGRPPRAAVVGGGASGLAAAKCLLDEGIEPVVFERGAHLGGIWNVDEAAPDGGGPAYRSLHTNTSRAVSGFSDFPLPGNLPDFPGQADMLRYLHDYTDHFRLRGHICLGTQVESARPLGDGRWSVRWSRGETSGIDSFDAVLVCTGLHHQPLIPPFPGVERFAGRLLHSRGYVEPSPFAGRRVVVVGAGSSGAEIATELSRSAASVALSTRGGVWFIPRCIGAHPADHRLNRLGNRVPLGLRMRVFHRLVLQEYHRLGLRAESLDALLPPAPFDIERSRFTPGAEVLVEAAAGRISIKPETARIEEHSVVFRDGTALAADDIIAATGYRLEFPFLPEALTGLTRGDTGLYRYVFPPDTPGLAFIGLCIPVGPALPIAELQARWVASVLAGQTTLPTSERMRREIAARVERRTRRGVPALRVQLLDYLDQIAGELGVRPRLARHPELARPLLLGPPSAAQYRLDGPGRWPLAADVLRGVLRPAPDAPLSGAPELERRL
ncbi:MAG TPA: NAD(P)-binding domain-containing protein [Thermomicrobiaceae bacterium]|nr:NAD(P)-binding domain-containing protein [Thermomicrobiaceae bacterium]